jgi:hypothetical protein
VKTKAPVADSYRRHIDPLLKKGGVKEEAVNLHPALGPSRRVTCSDDTHTSTLGVDTCTQAQ